MVWDTLSGLKMCVELLTCPKDPWGNGAWIEARPGGTKEHVGDISGSSMPHWGVTPQTDFTGKIPDGTETSWLPLRNHSEDSTAISNQSAKGHEEHRSGRTLYALFPTAGINRNFKYERGGWHTSLIAQIWVGRSWDHQMLFRALERKPARSSEAAAGPPWERSPVPCSMWSRGCFRSHFKCTSAINSNCIKTPRQASFHVHCCKNTPLIFINALRGRLDYFFFSGGKGAGEGRVSKEEE